MHHALAVESRYWRASVNFNNETNVRNNASTGTAVHGIVARAHRNSDAVATAVCGVLVCMVIGRLLDIGLLKRAIVVVVGGCCRCCSHIHSHYQVRGHAAFDSSLRQEELIVDTSLPDTFTTRRFFLPNILP